MGFDVSLLIVSQDGTIDMRRPHDDDASRDGIVRTLFPRTPLIDVGPLTLADGGFPERGALHVGCFASGALLATLDAHLYNPTKLHARYLKLAAKLDAVDGSVLTLITQRSRYDMFAYARWEQGRLVRSISVNPVGGVWENIGTAEAFEQPYWSGACPTGDPTYPLPFHPLDMAAAGLESVLRVVYESVPEAGQVAPEDVILHRFERAPR